MKTFIKIPFICAFFLLSIIDVSAQAQSSPCALKTEQLPEVRGLRLGMSLQDALHRYPNLRSLMGDPDANNYMVGDLSTSSYVREALGETQGEGLTGLKVAFLDKRLVRLRFVYSGLIEWKDVDEFLSNITSKLKLPAAEQWKAASPKTRQIDCDRILIIVRLDPKIGKYDLQVPSITFAEKGVEEILKEREKTKEERQRCEFKP